MTSKERVIAACSGGAQDHIPLAETLRHAVRQSGEDQGAGWVIQPDHVPLIEDFNVPRAVQHPVSSAEDVERIGYLYGGPDGEAKSWFSERIEEVGRFAAAEGFAVQAWSAFGIDAVVWFTGVQDAILLAFDQPEAFGRLVDRVAAADLARSELAAADPRVDLVVQRGCYSSTDFWSPALLEHFLFPRLPELAETVHHRGKRLA